MTNLSFTIPLNWKPVSIRGEYFPWHKESPKAAKDRKLIEGPRIYRWAFKKDNLIKEVYIGQSKDFQNRAAAYRSPTKVKQNDTDAFMKREFTRFEETKGTVELQFFEITDIKINGQTISSSPKSLGNQEMRMLLESFAILIAKSEDPHPKLINRLSMNVEVEKALRSLKKLSPEKLEIVLREAQKNIDSIKAHNPTS